MCSSISLKIRQQSAPTLNQEQIELNFDFSSSSPDNYHPAPTSDELEAIYTELAQTVGCPTLQVSPLVVNLQASAGQTEPVTTPVSVRNGSPGAIPWTATDDQPWLTVSPTGGNTPTDLTIAADASALQPSVYQATLTVSSNDVTVLNNPQTVIVNLIVSEPDAPPTEPITLTAVSGYDSIDLEWTVPNSTDRVDYQVDRRPENSSTFQPIAETDRPRHNDADPTLVVGQTYCYQVKARRADGSTIVASNEACAVLGEVELWVPDVWGAPRELVMIPINIRNPHGLQIAAADI